MNEAAHPPFSKKWMIASMIIFIACELLLGQLVGKLIVGKYASISLKFTLQGLLHVASFFVGGFIVGLISPGLRIHEPAAGAFFAVALMLSLTLFTPFTFIAFSGLKLIIGGVIALLIAMVGAELGEKLAGNRIPEE